MTTTDLARVSALLDEARHIVQGEGPTYHGLARVDALIDEAQRILVGDRPTRAEDN
jgi:hypothetical protein